MRHRMRTRRSIRCSPPLLAAGLTVPSLLPGLFAALALVRDWRAARRNAASRAHELAALTASAFAEFLGFTGTVGRAGTAAPGAEVLPFVVGPSNSLVDPPPGSWPPEPAPLTDPGEPALVPL